MPKVDVQLDAITQTKSWIEKVIIAYSFCPFAKRVFDNAGIHYQVISSNSSQDCLQSVIEQCLYLDVRQQIETSFVIFSHAFADFDDYLGAIAMAEDLLERHAYSGIYQIASFHPHYCFANQSLQDAANYTNRSPFPMFHIIRESSIDCALETFPNPEAIPNRNIRVARELGADKMKAILEECRNQK